MVTNQLERQITTVDLSQIDPRGASKRPIGLRRCFGQFALLFVGILFSVFVASATHAQTFTVGDYDVYINDQTSFAAFGNQSVFADPINAGGTAYGNGVTVSSTYALSLSPAPSVFAASGAATAVVPATGGTDGSVLLTDSTPVQALGFNIVDIFDHGEAGSFQDYITVSVNGTTLFTLSDGLTIASGQTGPVTLSAPGADGGAFGTTITQGQQVATFIGVVHNAGGTVNNFQISYDYNGPRINPVTGLPFNGGADAHGIDEMVEVTPRPIIPSNDAPASINGATGGNTNIGVLNGDTLNGDPATLTTVEITDPVA
ncbi:hypothetical protein, partial [Loktanella salsilacus]|uniref:hypothetical protein n=1 Tax=Loktanella salsilacus TaxID=195913 RepID=UPI003735E8BC